MPRKIPNLIQAPAKGDGFVSMHILLSGQPSFLLDALSEIATRRGHSVSRASPGSVPSAEKCDVLIVAAIGQPSPAPAKFVPAGIEAKTIALIIQDKQSAALALPSSATLTVLVDRLVGPGDPNGTITYWTRRMAKGSTVLAFGKAARKVAPFIDVRDASEWIIESVETGRTGTFRLSGEPTTIGQLLETARPDSGSGADAEVKYVSDDFLRDSGIDPQLALPLWSPATESILPAACEEIAKAEVRARPLKQTARDATAWEAANGTQTPLDYLEPGRETELLKEWPDYDPTGAIRRRHIRHIMSVVISVVLTIGAVVTFFIDTDFFHRVLDGVVWIDNAALGILGTFQPSMLSSLYYTDMNLVSQHIPGVDIHFWPVTALVFIISMVLATPWVLVGLYQQGGIVNLVGGLITLVFGILAWPVLAGILGIVGKLFPKYLPALEANSDQHGEIVVGRTLLAIGIPIYIYIHFFDRLSTGQAVVAGIVMFIVALFVLLNITGVKIESNQTSIFGEGILGLLSVAAGIAITLALGVAISGAIQFALTKTIDSFTLLVTELFLIIGHVTLAISLGFWTILDRLHLAKSVGETALEVKHLGRFHIRPGHHVRADD